MPSFNVLTEPWVPVVDASGNSREVGLVAVLESAHLLCGIADPSPPIQFGLYRILIAFITDAFQLREVEDVKDLLAAGRFDNSALTRYAEQCGDCFDLFSPDRPFLQSAGSPPDCERTKCIAGLAQHLPTGTFAMHFHHGLAEHHAFSPAVCARLLSSIAPFMTSGGAGLSPSVNGIPPWYVLVEGASLFETLVLNTCAMEGPWSQRPGTPAWRDGASVTPKQAVKKFTLLAGLTWRPRFVRVVPGDGGTCTYSGQDSAALVREMIFEPGLRALNERGAWIDPQAAYRISDDGISPLRPREGQVLWRETGPLALLQRGTYAGEDGKLRFERPAVVTQFRLLAERGAIDAARPMQIRCFGMRTDGKMKVFEWQTERLVIPAEVLAVPDAGRQVQEAMNDASWTSSVIQKAVKAAYPRDGAGNKNAFDALIVEARHHFWTGLRPRFEDDFLERLARQDSQDPDAEGRLRLYWQGVLRAAGIDALDAVLEDMDAGADALRRQVRARQVYWREWNKRAAKPKGQAGAAQPAEEIES